MGAEMRVHDPYVEHWYELESQDTYPAPGHSWARFFRNQEHLKALRIEPDLEKALKGAEALILAVPHAPYLELDPDDAVAAAQREDQFRDGRRAADNAPGSRPRRRVVLRSRARPPAPRH